MEMDMEMEMDAPLASEQAPVPTTETHAKDSKVLQLLEREEEDALQSPPPQFPLLSHHHHHHHMHTTYGHKYERCKYQHGNKQTQTPSEPRSILV